MVLRLRIILPYTIPGVLALLGWWWFYSRKKDDTHSKHKQITPSTDMQAESPPTELSLSVEIQSRSKAQLVQLDGEASAPQSTCFIPSVAQVAALVDMQPESKAEDILSGDSDIQNMVFDSLPQSSVECDIELHLMDSDTVCTKSAEHLQNNSSDTIQSGPLELDMVPSTEDGDQPCIDEIETVVKMSVVVQCPQSIASETGLGESGSSNTQIARSYQPELGAESQLKQDQLSPSLGLKDSELLVEPVTSVTTESLSDIKSACAEVMREGNCADILDAFSQCLEKSEQFEEGNAKSFFGNYEAKIVEQLAINIISKVIVAAKQEILASAASESSCQELDEANGEMLPKDAQCQQIHSERRTITVDVDSESCLGVHSTCEQREQPQVENIGLIAEEDYTQEYTQMEQYQEQNFKSTEVLHKKMDTACDMNSTNESTQMEQAQVEIMSNTAVDKVEASTQESTQMEQYQEKSLRTDDLCKEMDSMGEMDSTCESTQTEESLVEDKDLCPEKINEEKFVSSKSTHQTCTMPNLSPVHKNANFHECLAIMEDSSVSVCTSEDGISIEDQLQSTALSNVGVGSYDSLISSGVELSQETFNVSSEKVKKLRTGVNRVPYSNGEVKNNSLDLKNGVPWTGDTEADHSGGSDVNSMDSVDSGCALGKTEQVQNVKQKIEVEKAEIVIWEIEVPKHLVGRLIGKHGRYVNFLKESSGAKIYISTLPYTQDFQICHIEGSQQQVDRALSLIGKKFKELNLTNIYAPPPSLTSFSLPMTSWLMLPDGVTVEVIVVNVVSAGQMFVQQHTHPTFHALRGLDQQMYLCYSQPDVPKLPTPVEAGIICAAPTRDDAWWRAQVVDYDKDTDEVEIRYVDYGGYERIKAEKLRQIRSDFVTLPFQGTEVLLDNVIPSGEEDSFSDEADTAVTEMTRGTALLAQVTNYDSETGLPLVQLWSMMADEVVSINRTLVERGLAKWVDNY